MVSAPFPPLVTGGAGLERPPGAPDALRKRMAELYGVGEANVLPVRGVAHGVELVLRRVALDGATSVSAEGVDEVAALARLLRLTVGRNSVPGAVFASSLLDRATALERAKSVAPALLVIDERFVEFSDAPSLASLAAESNNLIVIRSLEIAYGLAGAPCAALIASPALIKALTDVCEPFALPTPIVRLAEAALDPVRAVAQAQRVSDIKAERARVISALRATGVDANAAQGPFVQVRPNGEARGNLRVLAVAGAWPDEGQFRLDISDRESNDRALAAFGVSTSSKLPRRAEIIRETSETRIVVQVDLDASGPVRIDTGVEFYDHMLSQIAVHGGFALTLSCAGDLGIDSHHTVEDCALALGQALSQALAARRGIARFGFTLPMDEAQAQVSVDLGGRPYLVFEGAFTAPALGAYATEMTEHVFRSLSQAMGAAIHVSVTGENDHHKTEACYKAFGRALRQAIRIEGDAVPSSKGVI